MGKKKECSCGYWNKEQEECLYNGSACIRDDERKKPEVTKEFIEKWANRWKKIDCYYEQAVLEMLKEAGVEVK